MENLGKINFFLTFPKFLIRIIDLYFICITAKNFFPKLCYTVHKFVYEANPV